MIRLASKALYRWRNWRFRKMVPPSRRKLMAELAMASRRHRATAQLRAELKRQTNDELRKELSRG